MGFFFQRTVASIDRQGRLIQKSTFQRAFVSLLLSFLMAGCTTPSETFDLNKLRPVLISVGEIPCSRFLAPYFDWVRKSPVNWLHTTIAFNNVEGKDPSGGLVTYTIGALDISGNRLAGDNLSKSLSDRKLSGRPGQLFSIEEIAHVGIEIEPDGTVEWTEKSFNPNKKFTYKSVCYSNNTMVILDRNDATGVLTLRKRSNRN